MLPLTESGLHGGLLFNIVSNGVVSWALVLQTMCCPDMLQVLTKDASGASFSYNIPYKTIQRQADNMLTLQGPTRRLGAPLIRRP